MEVRDIQQVLLSFGGSSFLRYEPGDEQAVIEALPGMVGRNGFEEADAAILGQWLTRRIELRAAKGATQQ